MNKKIKKAAASSTTAPTTTAQGESYHAKRQSAIAKHRANIPDRYRATYDRAVAKKSLRAATKMACLECVGWKKEDVRLCTSLACPLFPYRPYSGDPA